MILLDTNILIYATDVKSPQHEASRRVVDATIQGQIPGVIVPQVLVEFIGAATGPSMATPLTPDQACAQSAIFRAQIRTLPPLDMAFDELVQIVAAVGRAGRRTFDYYLAAQARALGIGTICTYNRDDFICVPGLTVLTPADVGIP